MVLTGGTEARARDFAVFFAGFMSAAVLWCALFAGLVAWGRRLISTTFFRWLNVACGLALAYFALALLWTTVHRLSAA